ncbi:MAG TPA: hypothetical protein VK434_07015 [Microvirga sp.]|nr:hypothetical protein [Microvirga sp.]
MTERSAWPVAGVLLAAAAVFALLLAGPGETVTTAYVNDLFIFLDGAHRIASGQVPNRDFHTALGPFTFYLPALGYWLSGSFGGAMPAGMALLILVLALPIVHILGSRLRPMIALAFGIFLLLILAVPMNLGESIASLSFAMFYNRVGWVALSALLVMYLRPANPHKAGAVLDTLCAAFLTVLMVYTKVTYGAVALAFLAFMLFDRSQRRWAAGAIGLTLLAGLAIEAFWQSSLAHLADLMLTSRVSGSRGFVDLAAGFLRHLADYVMLGIFVALVLRRTRSLRDLLFFGLCAGPGLLIQNQNSQPWGIITLHAGAAVAAEILLRLEDRRQEPGSNPPPLAAGAPLLLLALLLPTGLHCLMALGLHAGLAAARAGEPFGLPGFERVRLALLWSPGDHAFSTAYLASVRNGARLLATLPEKPRNVSVLDFANPFSAGLGLDPPRGDNAWLHWGRNVDAAHFLPPERLFAGVQVVMDPKWGINSEPLRGLYGDYIRTAFEPLRESDAWVVRQRRQPALSADRARLREPSRRSLVGAGDGIQP